MVKITKGQQLKDNEDLIVLSPTGDYDENYLVECAKVGSTEVFCYYEAQYVVNGNKVYDEVKIPE